MIISTHGIVASSLIASSASLILDTYTTAVAVYSLRRMRTAYAGDCIRVRRSSDNVEQNFGFVNNGLDTVALLAFTGANSGFVVTCFDQSGNGYNATQATAANQPRIVSAGVLDVQNTKACMRQIATGMWLDVPNIMAAASSATGATAVVVYNQPTTSPEFSGWGTINGDNVASPWSNGIAYDAFCSQSQQAFAAYGARDTLRTHTMRQTGSALQLFKNGTQIDTDKGVAFKTTPNGNKILNGWVGGNYQSDDSLCEAVFFDTALSTTDRQLLERNQGTFYGYTVA